MPTYLAIATAVADWSPVTITTFTPEALHFLTALSTPGLGGSARDSNPTNVKLSNSKFGCPLSSPKSNL